MGILRSVVSDAIVVRKRGEVNEVVVKDSTSINGVPDVGNLVQKLANDTTSKDFVDIDSRRTGSRTIPLACQYIITADFDQSDVLPAFPRLFDLPVECDVYKPRDGEIQMW